MKQLFLFHITYHNYTVIIRATTPEEASKFCLDYLMYGDVDFEFTEGEFDGIEPVEISANGEMGIAYTDAPKLPEKYKYLIGKP